MSHERYMNKKLFFFSSEIWFRQHSNILTSLSAVQEKKSRQTDNRISGQENRQTDRGHFYKISLRGSQKNDQFNLSFQNVALHMNSTF